MAPYRIFASHDVQSFIVFCETSLVFHGSLPIATMTSADFSAWNPYSPRSPQVRTYSFLRFLRHLPNRDCWLRASQRCACLPSLSGLRMPFLFVSTGFCSPASFTASSRKTSLRLTNRLHQLACKGLPPSGIIWYLRYQMPILGTHI